MPRWRQFAEINQASPGLLRWDDFEDMDIRDVAILHKGARMLLVEQKMERVYHMRLAQAADGKHYSDEISRLHKQLDAMQPRVPVTQEQAAKNRKGLAGALGLKPKKR